MSDAKDTTLEPETMFERHLRGVAGAIADAKEKGFKTKVPGGGFSGGQSSMKCAACESGTIHYSVARMNGHIMGACTTKGCVRWME